MAVNFDFQKYDIGGSNAIAGDGKLTGAEVEKARNDGWNIWDGYSKYDSTPIHKKQFENPVSSKPKKSNSEILQSLLEDLKYQDVFLNNIYKLSNGMLRIDGRGFEGYSKEEQALILKAHENACNETGCKKNKPDLMGTSTLSDGSYFPLNRLGSYEMGILGKKFGV